MIERVIPVIADKLGKNPSAIKPEHDLTRDLGADSLDLIDMLMALEEEHGVSIPDEVAPTLKTVQDVATYLSTLV